MGMAMPRRFGGLNFPVVPYIMAADIVSRSDAGFENLWGLQDCAETIYEFANEDQKKRYITRVCQGETMSMDLTEPDAGSDLQSVMLKATYSEKDECWYLNGVKRFITNGDADIHLVLARSEEGTHSAVSFVVNEHRQASAIMSTFFRACQHKVNVGVTVGNETFHSVQVPAFVFLTVSSFEHNRLQVGTGIGFRQVH
jgi:alkylation response protein AidB-like acyl-CoA dehydrogenase